MTPKAPSLTARLAALFALTSSVLFVALGAAIYLASDHHFIEQDAHDLHDRAEIIRNVVARSSADTLTDALNAVTVGHHQQAVLLLGEKGNPRYALRPDIFDAVHHHHAPTPRTPTHDRHPESMTTLMLNGHGWRLHTLTFSEGGTSYQLWLAIGIDHHLNFLNALTQWLIIGGFLATLLSGALGFWVARRGLAPLQKISANATLISAQRLSDRLGRADMPKELLPLIDELNAMLARLEDAFRRLNEFASDIAHELRTPISNLVTQTEVALTRARDPEAYREVLGSNLEEFDRLNRMIGDMLFLARADHGLLAPVKQAVDLAVEADALIGFYEALAEDHALTLRREGEARTLGDPLMLRRALANLLSNALRYGQRDSEIVIRLQGDGQQTRVEVCNLGTPIPEAIRPRLFDRFYRADFARERHSDGTGLGLAIVRSIAEAHGGTVSVHCDNGITRFVIALPPG